MTISALRIGQVAKRCFGNHYYVKRTGSKSVVFVYFKNTIRDSDSYKIWSAEPCELIKYHNIPGWLHYRLRKHFNKLNPSRSNRLRRERRARKKHKQQ